MLDLGEWVKTARTSAKLTQETLGYELNMTKANVSNMEKGKIKPAYETVLKIAQLTGIAPPLGDFTIAANLINNGNNHGIQIAQNTAQITQSSLHPAHSCKTEKMPDASMSPVLPENCTLTIDTAQTAIIDGKIYQIQSGERQYIRRLYSQIDGSLELVCDNKDFKNVVISSQSVQIVGRVIEWRVLD